MRRASLSPGAIVASLSSDPLRPVTAEKSRELKRRLRDVNDRRRYVLARVFSPRAVFYYDASRDSWRVNDPSMATTLKRRRMASAIKQHLGAAVEIIQCRVDTDNRVIESSVPSARVSRLREP